MKAFPRKNKITSDDLGMDLRDYFAAKAMPLVLKHEFWLGKHTFTTAYREMLADDEPEYFLAKCAYALADAMMDARKPKND